MNGDIFSWNPLPYFLERLSNEMQSTFHNALTNTIKKLLKKVATKWTFSLLCILSNTLCPEIHSWKVRGKTLTSGRSPYCGGGGGGEVVVVVVVVVTTSISILSSLSSGVPGVEQRTCYTFLLCFMFRLSMLEMLVK